MDREPLDVRSLRERLKALDCERQALMPRLRDLESRGASANLPSPDVNRAAVTSASTPADKIGLSGDR